MEERTEPAESVLALERAALDRWGRGDPSGYLEISDGEVTYFDPFLARRIDGLDALSEYYDPIRGTIRIDRDSIQNPRVVDLGGGAVLSFNYVSYTDGEPLRWNCTEVYRRVGETWKIVHTHWSFTEARE